MNIFNIIAYFVFRYKVNCLNQGSTKFLYKLNINIFYIIMKTLLIKNK